MVKMFVKKPYFILVAIVAVLAIGGVSLNNMKTNLMPDMELPYLAVITTEIGASPERVETDITKPMEASIGTISGVKEITSTSATNYSMIMMEFADDTNMDAALVRVTKSLNMMELPEGCGQPNVIEISPDMMPTMAFSAGYKGKNIEDLSEFTEKVVKPYMERQEGVGSVSANGNVTKTIEVRLNKKKIDEVNDRILLHTNDKLADAQKKIDKGQKKLADGKKKLKKAEKKLSKTQKKTNDKLGNANVQVAKVQSMKAAYESNLASLKATKGALEGEMKAYNKAKLPQTYEALNTMFATLHDQMGEMAKLEGVTIPKNVKDAYTHPKDYNKFVEWMKKLGQGAQFEKLTVKSLEQMYTVVEKRIPQIETELGNLKTKILVAEAIVKQFNKKAKNLDKQQGKLVGGSMAAAAGFGSGTAQMAAGKTNIESAEKQLEEAEKTLKKSKKAAREMANLDMLLTLDALSGLIYAQDFSMPAGYVDDKKDSQWLVQVGDHFKDTEELEDMVLTQIKGVGNIRLSDVADIVNVSDGDKTYAKVNGQPAVMLTMYKSSTANTGDVTKTAQKAFDKLEKKYKGLSITVLMNQGDFIDRVVNSVLSSMLLGALLAILVLALFLKSVKPTIIVAFSIPFSVLSAIVIMYFTDIDLNVMSLSGLSIAIGMLVDNSIVVMENIYRLRNHGISAARAAVQGTKQVIGPVIASTITTICVFIPMVYVNGTVADMMMPFVYTITYALVASLLVAMTVIPAMGSVLLKKTKPQQFKLFEKIQEVYGNILSWCLRFKVLPLGLAIILLVLCGKYLTGMGMDMMDSMESNQISVSLQMDKDTDRETAYATADQVMAAIQKVKGIDKVGVTDGNSSALASIMGGATDNFTSYNFHIITKDNIKTTDQFKKIRRQIEENTKGIKCEELTVSSSAMGSMGSMSGSGVQVDIYGEKQDKLEEVSKDVMEIMKKVDGIKTVENGLEEKSKEIHVIMDRDKVAKKGLTVAGIFQQMQGGINTEKKIMTMTVNDSDIDVNLEDETHKITYENIMNTQLKATTKNSKGEDVTKKYKLKDFAKLESGYSANQLTRSNQSPKLTVTGEMEEDENIILLSRKIEKELDKYQPPMGYSVEVGGTSTMVMDMMTQMGLAMLLGFLLIYLVMVAQFQSLLSPFIIIFTIPLAFTGGMLGLMAYGMSLSGISLMGFMILMGTVVNNGIVFVDYTNQLRKAGVERRAALVATGKTRMRPILMTAMTTILSMSVMVFSKDAGNAMQKGMAIVVCFGLLYSTFMTLFIVPIMYDILFRKQPKDIDVGDDNLDDIPDDAQELLQEQEAKNKEAKKDAVKTPKAPEATKETQKEEGK